MGKLKEPGLLTDMADSRSGWEILSYCERKQGIKSYGVKRFRGQLKEALTDQR